MPFAPGLATVTEIYTNDGSVGAPRTVLQAICERVPAGTDMIEVRMVRDFPRPTTRYEYSMCQMLLATDRHTPNSE